MARSKLCDFCLEEKGGLFHPLKEVPGGYHICADCTKVLESYHLPIRYSLFQQLVLAQPRMREMMMHSYLENHTADEALAEFYPLTDKPLHAGEELVTETAASIFVPADQIPAGQAEQDITKISRAKIQNITAEAGDKDTQEVSGTLYETNAALYFISEHILNVHRITNLATGSEDRQALHVIDRGREFTYHVENADLFLMRHSFYHILIAAKANKQENLVYLTSENTMTITPGVYTVPRNIKPGTYWLTSLSGSGVSIRDAAGHTREVQSGPVVLQDGAMLECTGEYQLHIRDENDPVFERVGQPAGISDLAATKRVPTFEEVTLAPAEPAQPDQAAADRKSQDAPSDSTEPGPEDHA